MEDERATELLRRERQRIEQELRDLTGGEEDGLELHQVEIDQGRISDLRQELEAVTRAEARVADGTYGRSIESGEPIPDGRLEAIPTAERTVDEEQRFKRAGG
jgi:DnaK suppressor protein